MAQETVDFTEFSRRVGVTRPRISQLVGEGKLPTVPGTKPKQRLIPWVAGLAAWQLHRGMADAVSGRAPLPSPAALASPLPLDAVTDRDAVEAEAVAAAQEMDAATDSATRYAAARARKETARARLAELDQAEREARLIPVDEVRADAVAVSSAMRAALLALPSQVALRCESKTAAEITALLTDHVNTIIAEWHTGQWVKPCRP